MAIVSAFPRSRDARGATRRGSWLAALAGMGIASAAALVAPTVLAASPAAPSALPSSPAAPPALPATPAASTLAPGSPIAEPDASPGLLEARAAFQQGLAFVKEGRLTAALEAFERSDAEHPHALTTYNIGYCELLLGHPTRARKMLAQALADHQARGSVELPPEWLNAAQSYLSDAERQIARVVVTIMPAALAPVTVDGRPLEPTTTKGPEPILLAGTRPAGPGEVPPAATFGVELDPGPHVFTLSVAGRPDVVANETLAPGSQVALELRVPAPVETTDAVTSLASPKPDVEPLASDRPNRVPAFVAFGIGLAGLGAGAVSGLIAIGDEDPVNAACAPPVADRSACSSKRASANTAADISTASFIAGGVAIGVGTVLLFTASSGKAASSSKAATRSTRTPPGLEIHPRVGWGTLGFDGRF